MAFSCAVTKGFMGSRFPFAIEIVVLVLILPLAFAYLLSITGIAAICLRTAMRRLLFRLNPPPPGP